MATLISHSPEDTGALGERWGRELSAGWVIGVSGDLGAGKTQLVKGLARGLGVAERILSPTFGLVHIYESGRMPLCHIDLYRLETPEQVIGAGLEEYLVRPDGITVVEWVERWWNAGEENRCEGRTRWVSISSRAGEFERLIEYDDSGG